jgi:hypothetical protein
VGDHRTTSQLDLFWPANFRPIPQKDSAWDAHTETENRQGEVGFLRYSPYGPALITWLSTWEVPYFPPRIPINNNTSQHPLINAFRHTSSDAQNIT